MSALTEYADARLFFSKESKREAVRRRIVQLVFIFYILLTFEGALRKWGLPQLEQVFFFIRVPIVLLLYWIVFRYGYWPRLNRLLLGIYLFAFVAIVLVPIQIIMGGYDPRYLMIAGYGWMNYFLYVPLAFVIREQFNAADIRRLIRLTVGLAVVAAPVVIWQFFSSPDSVINLGSGLDVSDQFKNLGAALGFVRPTGFFTSAAGQAHFVAIAAALIMVLFLQRRRNRDLNSLMLWIGVAAVTTMTMLSQSRSLFFMLGLILVSIAVAGILIGRWRIILRVSIWPTVLVIAAAILWPLLFPMSFEAFVTRWVTASASETQVFHYGIIGRAFYAFYGFSNYLTDTPFFGYLLGLGGNAANQLSWVQLPQAAMVWNGYGAWAEDGWSRHIIELGPPLGLCFILFRIMFTIWLGLKAVQATHRSGDILPVVLYGYVGIELLTGQITGQSTINGYIWIFTGVCLAAIRMAMHSANGKVSLYIDLAREKRIS